MPALCEGEELPQPRTMKVYPVAERDDHLFVWIGGEEPREGPFHFPGYGEPGWEGFFMHTRFEAPLEACLENFLDVPHTLLVHPGLFRGNNPRTTRAHVRRFHDAVEAEFLDEQPLQGIGPRLIFPRNTSLRHTDRFDLPSITRVEYTFGDAGAFVIVSQCTQREEYLVDVTTAITWRLPLPRWLARPFLRWYCRRVIQQDVAVLKVQGQQIRRFGRSHVSTAADLLGEHIGWLRRRAAAGRQASEELSETCTETLLRI